MGKTVCVIGAGVSGLAAVKACLEEGLQPTCYEKRSNVGGIWDYKKFERSGRARVFESVVTNVSKEAACFSDFPFPKEYPPFVSHRQMQKYLKSYATHFELERHIFVQTEIVNVIPTYARDPVKRKWKVTTQNLKNDSTKTEEFDCVIVSSGQDSALNMPKVPGLSDGTFNGRIMHSCEYDTPEEFKGRKVVVIGLGNSGADQCAEICNYAKDTYLSSRSGAWIVPRMFKEGLPPDMTATTRLMLFLRAAVPEFIGSWIARRLINSAINHDTIGLACRFRPMDPLAQFLVNDTLHPQIFSGKVKVKPDVTRVSGNDVYFTDGSKVEADVIICATGYRTSFPFISDELLPNERSELHLFEWMIPFEIPNPGSLAVIGLVPAFGGSHSAVVECQARYVAQVMSGITKLPPISQMRMGFEKMRKKFPGDKETFRFRKKLGVDYHDGVAELAGFYPYFWKIFFRDPRLAIAVLTGPYMSYHYRLLGRHQWGGARERIFNAIPNTLAGLGSVHSVQN